MNWRTKHTLVLVALLLSAGGWLAVRLLSHRQDATPSTTVAAKSEPNPSPQSIDLSPHFNDSLDEGWQHQLSAGNNLATLPRGRQVIGGVEFDLRGIIQLTSRKLEQFATVTKFPEQIRGIHVGRKCRQLHFLHAAGWNAPPGTWVGSYVIHFADGALEEVPILYGEGTGNWWAMPADLKRPGPGVVWQGTNAVNQPIQLFKQTWANPRPEFEIKSLDFESRRTRVAPFLIAVTVE